LVAEKKVIKEVADTLTEVLNAEFVIQADKEAWKNFQGFWDAYIRIRVAFIDGACKRPDEFKKRLRYFIEITVKNKQIGFEGIEKHY
jgi:Bacteriocin-protection, YdeI or OmpD-Associated